MAINDEAEEGIVVVGQVLICGDKEKPTPPPSWALRYASPSLTKPDKVRNRRTLDRG